MRQDVGGPGSDPAAGPSADGLVDAIGSIRVSTAREEMISPQIQRAGINDWARRHGRRIVRWIEDLDATGRNFNRKIMSGIEDIEQGKAREIVVYRYDRWGRNAMQSLANCRRVELAGGQVQSVTEPLDPETAIGRYSRTNALGLAEMQSDIIGDNWRSAHEHRRSDGLPSEGKRRFGYIRLGRIADPFKAGRTRRDPKDPDGERYVPDYDSGLAIVYGDLYCSYIAGATMQSFVSWLNGHEILNAHGRHWSIQGLTLVMDSGFAAGFLRRHNPACKCGRPGRCRDYILIPGAQEPIIDLDLWEAYKRRRKIVADTPARTLKATYPLSGLVLCGQCFSSMSIHSRPGRPGYAYRCSRYRDYRDCPGSFPRRAVLEETVIEHLRGWAEDLDARAAITRARVAARDTAQVDTAKLEKELLRTDKALAALVRQRAEDRAADAEMPAAVYDQARDDLMAERAGLEARLERARTDAERNAVGDFRPIITGVLEEWDIMPTDRLRNMLGKLIRHVTVYRTGDRRPPRVVVTPVWTACDDPCCTSVNVPPVTFSKGHKRRAALTHAGMTP